MSNRAGDKMTHWCKSCRRETTWVYVEKHNIIAKNQYYWKCMGCGDTRTTYEG